MKIGLVTCSELSDLIPGDQLLQKELVARGHDTRAVVWDAKQNWEQFDRLIIRNTWDYSSRIEEFLRWIDHVDRLEIPLFNPPSMIRWNSSKRYLRELEEKGVAIPETEWIPSGVVMNLKSILEDRKWKEAVVKPLISASARDTFRFTKENTEEINKQISKLRRTGVTSVKHKYDDHTAHKEVRPERDWMVQEFLPEIIEQGEHSLVFFSGNYSHTVVKTAKAGDYRIQERHGGTYKQIEPSPDLITQARNVLSKIPFDTSPLYARVDGIIRKDKLILTELEILEPDLYFATCPEAVKKLVDGMEK